ncbi:MAG: ribose 5-phosphate isomerase A [Bacteroidota bacterium]
MNWNTQFSRQSIWTKAISNQAEKQKVADQIAAKAKDGQVIGAGSGSTAFLALKSISCRMKEEGLRIKMVPTSYEIQLICAQLGVPTATLLEAKPDWYYDGADEVDAKGNLIKGRGGAMLREKLVLSASEEAYILVDQSKFVTQLGEKFAVPVEIIPEAIHLVERGLVKLGAKDIQLRMAAQKDGPVITENGNIILEVRFDQVGDEMEDAIKSIIGVVESGLFIGYDVQVIAPE